MDNNVIKEAISDSINENEIKCIDYDNSFWLCGNRPNANYCLDIDVSNMSIKSSIFGPTRNDIDIEVNQFNNEKDMLSSLQKQIQKVYVVCFYGDHEQSDVELYASTIFDYIVDTERICADKASLGIKVKFFEFYSLCAIPYTYIIKEAVKISYIDNLLENLYAKIKSIFPDAIESFPKVGRIVKTIDGDLNSILTHETRLDWEKSIYLAHPNSSPDRIHIGIEGGSLGCIFGSMNAYVCTVDTALPLDKQHMKTIKNVIDDMLNTYWNSEIIY